MSRCSHTSYIQSQMGITKSSSPSFLLSLHRKLRPKACKDLSTIPTLLSGKVHSRSADSCSSTLTALPFQGPSHYLPSAHLPLPVTCGSLRRSPLPHPQWVMWVGLSHTHSQVSMIGSIHCPVHFPKWNGV